MLARGAAAVAATVILSPWIIRNFELNDRFVPTMIMGGLVAFQGRYLGEHKDSPEQHAMILHQAELEQLEIAPEGIGLETHKGLLCVQRRLARSVGDSPTGVRVGAP